MKPLLNKGNLSTLETFQQGKQGSLCSTKKTFQRWKPFNRVDKETFIQQRKPFNLSTFQPSERNFQAVFYRTGTNKPRLESLESKESNGANGLFIGQPEDPEIL